MQHQSKFNIERMNVGNIPKIISFLKNNYGINYYGADQKYFDWFYTGCHCEWFERSRTKNEIPINAICDLNNEIIAIHAFIPFDVNTPDGTMRGAWDEEWINGSGIPGLGRLLPPNLIKEVDVYVGVGCNELSKKAFRKLGLRIFKDVPRLVGVINKRKLSEILGQFKQSNGVRIPDDLNIKAQSCHWELLPNTSYIPAVLFDYHKKIFPFSAKRSPQWVSWRYDNHPYIEYFILANEDKKKPGVAIIRLELIDGFESHPIARIVDLFPVPGFESTLLETCLSFAKSKDCLLIDLHTTSKIAGEQITEWAHNSGYCLADRPATPYMYQPPIHSFERSYNFVIASQDKYKENNLLENFHSTKADSVQDILRRPASGAVLKRRSEKYR